MSQTCFEAHIDFLNGPNPASFCLFSFFSHDKYSTNTINGKSGIWTRDGSMVGADESTLLLNTDVDDASKIPIRINTTKEHTGVYLYSILTLHSLICKYWIPPYFEFGSVSVNISDLWETVRLKVWKSWQHTIEALAQNWCQSILQHCWLQIPIWCVTQTGRLSLAYFCS